MEHRIAPTKKTEIKSLIEQLIEPGQARKFGIFKSKQKVLMFAAALGWHISSRIPLDGRDEPIRMSIFETACDDGFINALAVAETGNLDILDPEKSQERNRIFEEYANGGLEEMLQMLSSTGDNLEILLRRTLDVVAPGPSIDGVSPDLAKLFGN